MNMNEKTTYRTIRVEFEIPIGLRERFPTLKALLRDVVRNSALNKDDLAKEIGLPSGSRLARALGDNPNEKLFFPSEAIHRLVHVTGDRRPLFWLIDQCMVNEESRRQQATSQLVNMLPDFMAAVKAAGLLDKAKASLMPTTKKTFSFEWWKKWA